MSITNKNGEKILDLILARYSTTDQNRCECCEKYQFELLVLCFSKIIDEILHPLNLHDPFIWICEKCKDSIINQCQSDYVVRYTQKITNSLKTQKKIDEIKFSYLDSIPNKDEFHKELEYNKKIDVLLVGLISLLLYKKDF